MKAPRAFRSAGIRLALAAGATALALGCLATPAVAQTTSPRPAVGVQFHGTWSSYTDAQRLAVLDKLAAAGVEWVRIDIGWPSLQEQGPDAYSQWYVDRVDFLVDAARTRGLNVLGTLWRTPAWANGGRGMNVPPTDVDDYARVAAWAAEHFAGRVAAWEVWNEPDPDQSFWLGTSAQYAELLKAAYPAFKAGDPDVLVVLGGPSSTDDGWIGRLYEHGVKGSFDVVATHPYQQPADLPPETPDNGTRWVLAHVAAVHDLMVRWGDGHKPIWFTEFGWSSHPNTGGEANWERGVTAQQQADFLVRTIEYVGAKHPYVSHVFWYNERNNGTSSSQYDNYGLLYRNLAEKPAYFALRNFLTGSPVGGAGTATTGSPGADVLTGTLASETFRALAGDDLVYARSGADVVHGGPGNDRLHGGGGSDALYGRGGRDVFFGGAGHDRVFARDGRRDWIDCGRGRDRVVADLGDRVGARCEIVRRG